MIKLKLVKPRAALKPLHSKAVISPENFERFKEALKLLLAHLDAKGREEEGKNLAREFLEASFYRDRNLINSKMDMDWVIHAGLNPGDPVNVIIEAKSAKNQNEMIAVRALSRKLAGRIFLCLKF